MQETERKVIWVKDKDRLVQETVGSLVCGVLETKDGKYILTETLNGKTYIFVLSGKCDVTLESVVFQIYSRSISVANAYVAKMKSIPGRYYCLDEEDADPKRVEVVSRKLDSVVWIIYDDPAYEAYLYRKLSGYSRMKFREMLAELHPEARGDSAGTKYCDLNRYASISYIQIKRRGIVVSVDNHDGKPPTPFKVAEIKRDEHNIAEIVENMLDARIPAIGPWWQEKFRVAHKYLKLLDKVRMVETEYALDNLCKRLDAELAPFLEDSSPINVAFCALLRTKREVEVHGCNKSQKIK